VGALRDGLSSALARELGNNRFDFIRGQRGMFSLLGLAPAAVSALAAEHHVYVAGDSRINVAGLPEARIERVARAIRAVAG
jgi:aromatic-amino-acid transaminase